MKNFKQLLLIAFIMSSGLTFSNSEAGQHLKKINEVGWEILGQRVVNMGADHDEILITAAEGVFTQIKLEIRKAPIHLTNINIVFGNGENKNVAFNKDFAAGSETHVIDLPGNKRIIKKVNLNYTTKNWNGKGRSVVVLWGKH